MSEVGNIIRAGEAEISLLFHHFPQEIKHVEAECLHVCNVIKTAMASPEAEAIEAALAQIIPGGWEAKVMADIGTALSVAVPLITNQQAAAPNPIDQGRTLVKFLQGLGGKMQHAGLLKLLSGLFMDLAPKITEVEADTAAQVIYAKSTLKAA